MSLYLFLVPAALLVTLMTVLWLHQRRTQDAGIVDVGWSMGIGLVAMYAAVIVDGLPLRRFLVALLAGAWSLRLAGYIYRDRVSKGMEDARYASLRAYWGDQAEFKFFWFFQAQALLVLLFATPICVAMSNPTHTLTGFDAAAVLMWITAVFGESIADGQLARFRADPANRGGVCDHGLWRYSRHPNYFFEWFHWFAYVAFAVGSPYAALTAIGPVLMFLFLFKVTGIPATEKQALKNRGGAYRDYQARTNAFFPWFPRRNQKGAA